MPKDMKKLYDEEGYIILPDLIESNNWSDLEKACESVIARTREGSWPYRRTVGKQFPPYGDDNPDSWGVQHVMHPDLREPVFNNWYTSPKLLEAVTQLLMCREDDLQMELFNLLINPISHDFALRWHRDDVHEDATREEEQIALDTWHYGVQWNTALYEDSCLLIVPQSHKSPRTEQQRLLSCGNILENPLDMPGSVRITLQPGETVFYNSNILHCATYDSKKKRATLHACMGNAKGGSSRARNVLQHGLDWMKEQNFRDSLTTDRARGMLDNLINMYNDAPHGMKTAYSLQN